MPKAPTTPKPVHRLRFPAWLGALAVALIFLGVGTARRIGHIERVSELASEGGSAMEARGPANLIIPERNENSLAWIRSTQLMLAEGRARIRRIDTENAPAGHETVAASPYRWWLAATAALDRLLSGHAESAAVEYGALLADPLLLAMGLAVFGWLTWRRFGALSSGVLVIGCVGLFPLAAAFLPGVPDIRGLTALLVLGQVLGLVGGLAPEATGPARRRWFAAAGVLGGIGFWINVPVATALLLGLALGGIAGIFLSRAERTPSDQLIPWRWWSGVGAATVLLSYFIEFAPSNLGGWRLDAVHPVYGVAWIGFGECLVRLNVWRQTQRWFAGIRDVAAQLGALAAVALPIVIVALTGRPGWTVRDLLWARLDSLSDGVTAASTSSWIAHDGFTARTWATLLPFLILALVFGPLASKLREPRILLAAGAALVAAAVAVGQLSWWVYADAALLVLGVALAASRSPMLSPSARGAILVPMAIGAMAGLVVLWPGAVIGPNARLTTSESEELVERHVARWLAVHSGDSTAVVFAPPHLTTTLGYYGGFRGIGTYSPENQAGFGTSLAIAGVKTMEEVQELLRSRNVRYLVLPSWDPFFDNFASLYLAGKYSHRTSYLATELRHWNLPPWLRPIPYQLPVAGDFMGQTIAIFEVVDEQSPVTAASRLAEYFVETGNVDRATTAATSLRQYPGDVSALVAQAQVALAREDTSVLPRLIDALQARVAARGDRYLPWDRRVSLAMVLARANRLDEAQAQLRRTVTEVNEEQIRALTTGSLFGWQVLLKAFHQEIPDARLRALARELLPSALREKL